MAFGNRIRIVEAYAKAVGNLDVEASLIHLLLNAVAHV